MQHSAKGCSFLYCLCQEAQPALTEEDIQRGMKKRSGWEMETKAQKEKKYTAVETSECELWKIWCVCKAYFR